MLLVGLISIAVATYYTQRIVNATAKREFRFDIQEIQNRISSRIAAQEQVLRSGAAFLAHATGISRQEWRRFVERQNVAQPLTGIQGVGFARLIPHERLAQHIQEVRAEGFPDYQVRPAGERENYSTIVYLEPFASRNLLAFGYDMLTEPVRRVAMERARDLDVATLSGKVKLVQETDEDIQAGTLMYVPVYGAGMPIATVDQRRAALQGWIYSPYRMTDLMRGILGQWDSITDRRIRLEIFDGESPVPAALLYDSQPAEVRPQETAEALISQRPLVVAGRQWGLRFSKTADSTASTAYLRIWLTLFGGTCVSLLLCGLVFALVETQLTTKQSAQRSAAELRQREAQTLASAQLLQAIIDHSQCLTYAKDIEGRHILASQPLAKLFGLQSSEQVLGKTLHDFLPPAMADQLRANDLAVVARRSPLQTEEITESPDGPRVFLSTKFPIFDALDRVIAVCGVSFDITHLRRIEDALRESEAHYRSLFDNMLNGLAYCQMLYEQERPSDFIYLSVNPAFQASTGLKDVVGKKISEVIPGICEADPELFEILGRVARTGAPDNFEIYLQSLQMWFAISAYQPAPDHFVAVFEVITQRKQAELATSRLAAIVASSDDAIIGKDLDGVITTWNQGAEKIFGYTASEMIGVSIMRLIPADRQQEEDQILAKIQRGEGINHFETLRQAKDGRLIDVSITSSPIRDAQGRVFGVSKVARDITKRKQAEAVLRRQAEELQARNDELERFNRVMMDREMRVIDLKQKINALAEELGQPQHYSMRFLDPANGELHRAAGSPDRGGDRPHAVGDAGPR